MAVQTTKPRLRSIVLYGATILALALVSTVAWVMLTDRGGDGADDVFPELVHVNPEMRPRFVFPDELRTSDLSVNRFIDRFLRVCAEGRYSQFRLMFSTQSGDRILPRDFESIFNALKVARIRSIKRLPEIAEIEGPLYVLAAEYDLEDYTARGQKRGNLIHLAIVREEGEWRIGRIPRAAMARLQAYERATSQPDRSRPAEGTDVGPRKATNRPPADAPKAAANRPARIDS